jgi:hypothetical protein
MTPMQFQYLVGLCCLQVESEAVKITLGDMVYDDASEKKRDMDITVSYTNEKDELISFKGFEAKKEKAPLDVIAVEQLCSKFKDMTSLTYGAIVSASGYTAPAVKKAGYHKIDLFQLEVLDETSLESFPVFNSMGMTKEFFSNMKSKLLCWNNWSFHFYVSDPVQISDSTTLFSKNKKQIKDIPTIQELTQKALQWSTDNLWSQFDYFNETEARDQTYYLDLMDKEFFVIENGKSVKINGIQIKGELYWKIEELNPKFHILKNITTNELFSGALISPYQKGDSRLLALVLTPESNKIGINHIVLTDKQKSIISGLELKQDK